MRRDASRSRRVVLRVDDLMMMMLLWLMGSSLLLLCFDRIVGNKVFGGGWDGVGCVCGCVCLPCLFRGGNVVLIRRVPGPFRRVCRKGCCTPKKQEVDRSGEML